MSYYCWLVNVGAMFIEGIVYWLKHEGHMDFNIAMQPDTDITEMKSKRFAARPIKTLVTISNQVCIWKLQRLSDDL